MHFGIPVFALGVAYTFFIIFIGPLAPPPATLTWQQDKIETINRFKAFQASKPELSWERARFMFINETLKAMPKHDFDDIERLYSFIALKDSDELVKK